MFSDDSIFSDLVVIEAANILAGPAVGMFFAELGATVIKVENLKARGDTTRHWKLSSEPVEEEVSAYFSSVNWGKKSIAIDFSISDGHAVLLDLLRNADIFLQSFKPGDAEKFMLDYPALRNINSKLIYADITAFGGQDNRAGFDAVLQAETGFMGMNGTEESGPMKMPVALIDLLLAHQLKEALLIALIKRMQSGRGSYNTVSLFHAGITSLANQASNYLVADSVPHRSGSDHPNIAPYGTIYGTRDQKFIVLAIGTDNQFQALCEEIGIPDTARDVRFRTNQQRVIHRDTLSKLLEERIRQRERESLLAALRLRKVPVGAVRTIDEILKEPASQSLLLDGQRTDGESICGLRTIAFESDAVELPELLGAPPDFNQDGRYVLGEVLGYTDDCIDKLKRVGAIL